MSRLATFLLLAFLLAACSGISSPPVSDLPGSTRTPKNEQLFPVVTREPTADLPPGEGVISPPGGSTTPGTGEAENPYAPKTSDALLERGIVYLDPTQLLIPAIFPARPILVLKGNLPDSCHHLRVAVPPPDDRMRIEVEVYSVTSPGKSCIQALQPFEANINLGSFPAGHYTVWINGNMAAEFDA